jgi:ribosomal protein S18 acetylase RimI-like enzyme
MITETQFMLLRDKATKFDFSYPLEYDECMGAEVLQDTDEMILLYDKSKKPNRIYWACNDPAYIMEHIENIKETIRIDFVPKTFIPILKSACFSEWAEWVDFFNNELAKTSISFNSYDSIRFIKPEEIPAIMTVFTSCEGSSRGFAGETEDWFRNWIKENDIIVIGEGTEIAGYCCVSIYASGTILWVRELAVEPSHRRKGFGRSLLEQAILYGIYRGAKRGFLHADIQNKNAINLYNKYGFVAQSAEGELQMIRIENKPVLSIGSTKAVCKHNRWISEKMIR